MWDFDLVVFDGLKGVVVFGCEIRKLGVFDPELLCEGSLWLFEGLFGVGEVSLGLGLIEDGFGGGVNVELGFECFKMEYFLIGQLELLSERLVLCLKFVKSGWEGKIQALKLLLESDILTI